MLSYKRLVFIIETLVEIFSISLPVEVFQSEINFISVIHDNKKIYKYQILVNIFAMIDSEETMLQWYKDNLGYYYDHYYQPKSRDEIVLLSLLHEFGHLYHFNVLLKDNLNDIRQYINLGTKYQGDQLSYSVSEGEHFATRFAIQLLPLIKGLV